MVELIQYGDPERLLLARVAAEYRGKPDITNIKRPLQLLRMRHMSIFRHPTVTVRFITSLVTRDHLFRYTTAAMAAAGLRINTATEFVSPGENEALGNAIEEGMEVYQTLLDNGVRMQDARYAVPCGAQVSYIMTFNFQTLMEAVFPQRLWAPGAQAETQQTVEELFTIVHAVDPTLWEEAQTKFGPEALHWQQVQRTLRRKDPALYQKLQREYGHLTSSWDQ
jgi:thymidylate synthase ThyX